MKKLIQIALLTLVAVAGAWADDVSITLDDPNQQGSPGQTLNFFGTITNTDTTPGDAPIYLNFDSLNLSLSDATVMDNFFANVPISLAEGQSSGDIDLFDVTVANPEANPLGIYPGTYGLLGGMDGGANTASDSLAQVNFSVEQVAPEPATYVLILGGLAGIAALRRRRIS